MSSIRFNIFTSLGTMLIAWFLGYLAHAFYQVNFSGWDRVTDFTAIYFWTGLFALLTAVAFVWLIVRAANKTAAPRLIFPLLTTLSAPLAMSILLLPLTEFQPWQMGWYYYVYSAIVGLIFGLLYEQLYWLGKNNFTRVLTIVILVSFQLFLFRVLPYVAPGIAYRYFGDSIRGKAVAHVLSNVKTGDSIEDLNKRLPGFADFALESGGGQSSGAVETVEYEIEYEDYKVKSIEVIERK